MFFLGVGQLLLKFPLSLSVQLSQTGIPSSTKALNQGFSFARAQSCRKCRTLRCPIGPCVDSCISEKNWNEINSSVCAGLGKHLRNQQEVPSEGSDWRGWRCYSPCIKGRKKRKAKSHISSCLCHSWAGRIGDKMIMRRLKSLSQRKSLLFQSYFNLLKTRLRVAAFPYAACAWAVIIICIRK